MTNYLDYVLVISGDPEEIRECLASIGSPSSESADERLLDFHRLNPRVPTEEWGKYNALGVRIDRRADGRRAEIVFGSANWFPQGLIRGLADRFKSLDVELQYLDTGGGFAGSMRRSPKDRIWRSLEAEGDDAGDLWNRLYHARHRTARRRTAAVASNATVGQTEGLAPGENRRMRIEAAG